jgi:tRNA(Ile)-lysidine synthase TilS/MesJ
MSTISLHPVIEFVHNGNFVAVHNRAMLCSMCVLPETFPGIIIGEDGLCSYCRDTQEVPRIDPAQVLQSALDIIHTSPNRSYDCLFLYSGGKDSSMGLYTLVTKFKWRVAALTLDNGFTSDTAITNAQLVTSSLAVDHIIHKPARKVMNQLYSISLQEPFSNETTKYSTSACGSCISVVLSAGAEIAMKEGVPLMAGGWTPGQFTDNPLVPASFIQAVCSRHFDPLLHRADELAADELKDELRRYNSVSSYPHLFNPLYLERYDEHAILDLLGSLGWKQPKDTDSCSSNCCLNGFLVLDHLAKYGYHPYVYELAQHVRRGFMDRQAAIERVSSVNVSIEVLMNVCRSLDVPLPFALN